MQWERTHLPKQETLVRPLSWEDLLEEEVATQPIFLPRKFHGQRNLAKKSDMTEHTHEVVF